MYVLIVNQPSVVSRQLDDAVLTGYVQWHALRGRRLVTCFLEFCKDSYTAQSFSGTLKGEDVLLAWAANLQYMSLVPTMQEVIASMTFLRRMFLTNAFQAPAGWNLVTLPVDPSPT